MRAPSHAAPTDPEHTGPAAGAPGAPLRIDRPLTGPDDRPLIQPVLAVAAVLLGSFIVGFDTRLFAIGLPDLRGAFGLSFDQGSWLSTVATAPQILIAPAVPWLAATFGVGRVLFWPSLAYAAVSLLIPEARGFEALLALHAVRGLLLGVFIPATIMIIFRRLPIRWWVPAIAIYCFRLAFSQSVGIALVGFYDQHWGWQWVYWQDVLLAPLIGLLIRAGTPPARIDMALLERADWGGMALLGTGWALVYVALDQGNRLDWLQSGLILTLLVTGGLLVAGFFLNEMLVAHPWASHRVVARRNVLLAFLAILCFDLAQIGSSSLVPNFLTAVAGLRPEEIGVPILMGTALPLVVLMPLAVFVVRRFDARLALIIGFTAFAIAGWLGTGLTHQWAPWTFLPMLLIQAVGQAFTFLAAVVYILANTDPRMATAVAAHVQVLRLGGAEIALSVTATLLRQREQLHSYLIGLHVPATSFQVKDALHGFAAPFAGASGSAELAGARGLGTLAGQVAREANVLAYIDLFQVSHWAALAGLLVVALMGAPPPGPLTPKLGGTA